MELIYDKKSINTQDEIKITIADLRDLIQAGVLLQTNEAQAINEYSQIVETISRKNRLPLRALAIE